MTKKQIKAITAFVGCLVIAVIGLIVFALVTENIGAGYVGYRYDRTVKNGADNAIPGTSVINEPLTGLDEINQKIVDEQKAESEKELLKRKNEADAAAYEKEKAAQAQLAVAENNVKIAEQKVTQAQLEKEAELEKQRAFTEEYFRDKELDVQKEAVKAINSSVKTIVTDGAGSGYGALAGLKEILGTIE